MCVIYISIVYWLNGLNPNFDRFTNFIIIESSLVTFGISYGLAVGSVVVNPICAQILGISIAMVLALYGDVFASPFTIPPFIYWLTYVSPVQYAFVALLKDIFKSLTFIVKTREAFV